MAELRHWHDACLTIGMGRSARLFVIKTRTEAWFVIYAIALGAVERAQHYLQAYPGFNGWTLALACTGVVFLARGQAARFSQAAARPGAGRPLFGAIGAARRHHS